ncbi:MAG: HlyD family type I secretion periplasmic adaptor subunit [Marinicaulis sp.]|nr:HlyD family type I secretion periplasmic adaptor subunit [Marinicaulis sp.]
MQGDAMPSPPPTSTFIRFGLGVIIAVFGGLLLWSVVAPINGAVIASGQVMVESNRKTVQHLDGGVVSEILVREDQLVGQGQVLVRFDSTITRANLTRVESQLAELYARRARLLTVRDGKDELSKPSGIPEILEMPSFAAIFEGQKELFTARLATLDKQISLLGERVIQQEKRMGGLSAQRRSIAAQSVLIKDELKSVRSLYEKGFAPLTRLRALERESERLTGEGGSLTAALAEADSIIAEAQLEIERLKGTAREEAIAELRDVEVSIAEFQETRVTAAHALRHSEIRAPQAGRVIGLSIHTIGGVVAPGAAMMEIVPDGDKLEIMARVSPRDIDKVRAGQSAIVRFSSFSARMTPQAVGIVRSVSADSLVDQITGAPYYLVLIDLPEASELKDVLHGALLVPGMPAETFIRTGRQPAISFLLRPLTDALARSMREH